jgi:5'-3' exonuclease
VRQIIFTMGVRFLNRLIQEKCSSSTKSVRRIHFEQLRGKKIAVDVSIFMYRFLAEGALLENMYLMASIFRYYDINAIFVFDGPPPAQKTDVIEQRKKKKDAAKKQYSSMESLLRIKQKENRVDRHEIIEIEETMTQLKKQFIHIRDNDISNVKDLIVSFGFTIVDAEGEADALCAKLANKRRVYACMSDDTDMFVYGCPFVLRHVSFLNHSAICYDTEDIMKTMGITHSDFKMLCVVSGTDYNTNVASPVASAGDRASVVDPYDASGNSASSTMYQRIFNLYDNLKEYIRLDEKEKKKYEHGFYEWLEVKKKYDINLISLLENERMFDLSGVGSSDQYKQLVVLNRKDINKRRIIEIMMKEDFIFIESHPEDRKILDAISKGCGSITSSAVYGVGNWESACASSHAAVAAVAANTASRLISSPESSSSSASPQELIASRRETIIDNQAIMADAMLAVKDYETQEHSQDYKASILASEVYGVDANSLTDLKRKIRSSSKPVNIKKRTE